jgi:hypothetical protein
VNNLTREGAKEERAVYAEKARNHHAGAHTLAVMLKKDGKTYQQIADILNKNDFKTLRNAACSASHVLRMFRMYGLMMR